MSKVKNALKKWENVFKNTKDEELCVCVCGRIDESMFFLCLHINVQVSLTEHKGEIVNLMLKKMKAKRNY